MRTLEQQMRSYRPDWDLRAMRGGHACLKWNLKDLPSLDLALQLTKGRKAVVQAGGNLGLFPKRLAEEFAAVYTFEPDKQLFAHLEHNAPEPNIVSVCAALGCSREPVSVDCRRRDQSGRPVHEGLTFIAGAGDIPQVMIDDLALEHCNLIYLDVEGYELNALKGAVQTLQRCRPTLALESNTNIKHYASSRTELHEWVVAHGYKKITRINGDDIYKPT